MKARALDRVFSQKIVAGFVALLMVGTVFSVFQLVTKEDRPMIQTAKAGPLANHVVISEFFYDETSTDYNEFVELYNPTGSPIDIAGWVIEHYNQVGDPYATPWTVITGDNNGGITEIPAYGYYLIGKAATLDSVDWDYTIAVDEVRDSGTDWQNGPGDGIRLMDDLSTVIDGVEYGSGGVSGCVEGTYASPSGSGNSIERKSNDTHVEDEGNALDNNDNSLDFRVRSVPNPQNTNNASEMPPGGGDTDGPLIDYAITTGKYSVDVYFNENVNEGDVETLANWKIILLGGYDGLPPSIKDCYATSTTSVVIEFSETVNKTDAETASNYAFDGGLTVQGSPSLAADLQTLTITTNSQTIDQTYTVTVNNINDTADPPNVIDADSQASFNGGGGGGTMTVVFIDVDQGAAVFIQSPSGDTMLYDAGQNGYEAKIGGVLSSYGVSSGDPLEYTVASHYDSDHIGSLDYILSSSSYTDGSTIAYDRGDEGADTGKWNYQNYVDEAGGRRQTLYKNDVIDLGGGATATCVQVNYGSDENDRSVCLKVQYRNFGMWLGGDVDTNVEAATGASVGEVEVYYADHHGSKYSSADSGFLSILQPNVTVFSVGSNSYGHVHQQAWDRCDIYTQPTTPTRWGGLYSTNLGNEDPGLDGAPISTYSPRGLIRSGDIPLTTNGDDFTVDPLGWDHLYNCKGIVDDDPPEVASVKSTGDNWVELTFTESVNQADAETESNYDIDGGIGPNPSAAVLDLTDLKTVNLTTGAQVEGKLYNITINNIRDRASPANTIVTDTKVQFTGGQPLLGITSVELDGSDPKLVHVTTEEQVRMGYEIHAMNIRDILNNVRDDTYIAFVGGGYHLTFNTVYANVYGTYEVGGEWWEIYNAEDLTVDVGGWRFSDNIETFQFPGVQIDIPSQANFTVAADSDVFFDTYGYFPDFAMQGNSEHIELDATGAVELGNDNEFLAFYDSYGRLYDVVQWGTPSPNIFPSITSAPAAPDGDAIQRKIPGKEGPENVKPGSPTGADEGTEDLSKSWQVVAWPAFEPQTMDSNPPHIQNVNWDIGPNYATVYWDTYDTGWPEINPYSDSKVVYSTSPNPDISTNTTVYDAYATTGHGLMLYPLQPNTDYYFFIESADGKDQVRRDDNTSNYYHIKTSDSYIGNPSVSNVNVEWVTDTSALITWDTNRPCMSTVYYDTGAPLTMIAGNSYLTTTHNVQLSGLTADTIYLFDIVAEDSEGNVLVDDNSTNHYNLQTLAVYTLNFYRANLDSYTSYSAGAYLSGNGDPDAAYNYADNRIDILGINDFSSELSGANYTDGKAQAVSYTFDDFFVALYGQALYSESEPYGQISVYNEAPEEIASGDALDFLDDGYQWVADHNGIGIFSQPGYLGADFDNFAYNATADEYMIGLQVLDGSGEWFRNQEYYKTALAQGWHVGAIGGQRNVNGRWGNEPVDALSSNNNTVPLTMVKAESLTEADILSALQNFQFYTFEANTTVVPPPADPILSDYIYINYSINGHDMGSQFEETGQLFFDIEVSALNTFDTISVYEDGRYLQSWYGNPSNHIEWNFGWWPEAGEHSYFFKAEQNDGTTSGVWSSPIWVNVPARSMPDDPPAVGYVSWDPTSPLGLQYIDVTAPISDDKGIFSAWAVYSIDDGSSWSMVEMKDDGVAPDTAVDGTFTGRLPNTIPDGTGVQMYINAFDTIGQRDRKPASGIYEFYVGARCLINEVHSNGLFGGNGENDEFIEIYNPTGSTFDLSGWIVVDEFNDDYSDTAWAFPGTPGSSTTTLANGDYLCVTPKWTDTVNNNGLADVYGLGVPVKGDVYELYDTDGAVVNMIPVPGDGTREIELLNSKDAVYLMSPDGYQADGMEYGGASVAVRGEPASDENSDTDSNSRNELHMDTDNCAVDFQLIDPATPLANADTAPVILNLVHSPSKPEASDPVSVSCDVYDSSLDTVTGEYSIDGTWDPIPGWGSLGGDSYGGTIPAQAANTAVYYRVTAEDLGARVNIVQRAYSVWPHLIIDEVYYNAEAMGDYDEIGAWTYFNTSAFIEIHNPGSSPINLNTGGNDWWLSGEPMYYNRNWTFPSGTIIGPHESIVIAKTAGDPALDSFLKEFYYDFSYQLFEMYDSDVTYYTPITDHDNTSIPNMVHLDNGITTDDKYDDQISLSDYYMDAIYLYNPDDLIVDGMGYGYGADLEFIVGDEVPEVDKGISYSRDFLERDSDDSATDFHDLDVPSPGLMTTFISLSAGTSLISMPLNYTDPTVANAFAGIDGYYYNLNTYNANLGYWLHHRVGDPLDPTGPAITIVDKTMGYNIRVGVPGTYSFSGMYPSPSSAILEPGWNLIGYADLVSDTVQNKFTSDYSAGWADIQEVQFYNRTTQSMESLAGADPMEPTYAYWVYCTVGGTLTWTPPA